jgi:hypothetical protein
MSRRKNPLAGLDGEDIAVIGVAIFACWVVYEVVVKPVKGAECGITNFLKSPSPLCPAFYNNCPQ